MAKHCVSRGREPASDDQTPDARAKPAQESAELADDCAMLAAVGPVRKKEFELQIPPTALQKQCRSFDAALSP